MTKTFILFHLTLQTINFTEPFYAPPVVLVTAKHSDNNNNSNLPGSRCNAVTAWVEVCNLTGELGSVGYGIGEDLRGYPCKNRPLDFRPKIEFLQIFCVRQLVHMINKISKNLVSGAIFQYYWRRLPRTVNNG